MKAGCLFIIALMVGAYFGYRQLLLGTELEDQYWLPIVLAVVAAFVVANIQGIFIAINQRSALDKPRGSWKDGELVGVSGRIQAVRSPIITPFSKTPAVIAEYEIKYRTHGENSSDEGAYSGFLMSPCQVSSTQGSVKLVGFPIMTEISPVDLSEQEQACEAAGAYLAACTFDERATNPIEAIKQLNAVLSDEDGEIRSDYSLKKREIHLNDDGERDTAENIAARLLDSSYLLTETFIPNGAQVTAFGSYRAARQVLDIGSGLSNLSHGIKLGTAAEVTGRALRRSIIMSVFFLAAFTAGNYYVLKLIGYEIVPMIMQKLQVISGS